MKKTLVRRCWISRSRLNDVFEKVVEGCAVGSSIRGQVSDSIVHSFCRFNNADVARALTGYGTDELTRYCALHMNSSTVL